MELQTRTRAGRYILQPAGYPAFLPSPLPPDPPVALDGTLLQLLSLADQSLGRLDGTTQTLPNADLFVAMYVRQEAVLSSQIEGTQSSLRDILEFEADAPKRDLPGDVGEVYNYVRALNYGLKRLATLPLSLRLIREVHRILLRGVRGSERTPGEFRRSQNWIGPAGSALENATFIPPPAEQMMESLGNLEKFLHAETQIPPLVCCALMHAQFETIHPFLDGNGRVGRLLITLMLCEKKILHRPLLYLSLFFKAHRPEYYERLMRVRTHGDWEGWIEFFLRGVHEVSAQANQLAGRILAMQEKHRMQIERKIPGSRAALRLHSALFRHPAISVRQAARVLRVSFPTANHLLVQFTRLGLLQETTGRSRGRLFAYQPYLELFQRLETEKRRPGS